jgi:purine-cytosine permease-like protein
MKNTVGKLFLSFCSIVFGGVVVAGVMKRDLDEDSVLVIGIIAVVVTAVVGIILTNDSKNDKK